MEDGKVELGLYQDCLYEIKRRIDVIAEHLNGITNEKYWIIEIETLCLQFRKILEKIMLMSLVANKDLYAEQNEKFARHYHAERIMRDLERLNPDFYPVPVKRVAHPDSEDELIEIESGYLTRKEFIQVYERCGGMLHAQNPFAEEKPLREARALFPEWLTKICILLAHHRIRLVGDRRMVVAIMERKDNGLPQAVVFEKIE